MSRAPGDRVSLPGEEWWVRPEDGRWCNAYDNDDTATPRVAHLLDAIVGARRRLLMERQNHTTTLANFAALRQLSDLETVTADILEWQGRTFPHATPESVARHLRKESKELLKAPRDPMAIADCYFLIVGAAHRAGVHLVDVLAAKLRENRGRQWGEPDEHGVVEHVRSTEGGQDGT